MIKTAIKNYSIKHNIKESEVKKMLSKELFKDVDKSAWSSRMSRLYNGKGTYKIDELVPAICTALKITPNELFRWSEKKKLDKIKSLTTEVIGVLTNDMMKLINE